MKKVFPAALAAAVALTVASAAQAETLYAGNATTLLTFDSATPGVITNTVAFSFGSGPVDSIVGIDVRPFTNVLYGVGSSSRIYTINPVTGVATAVNGTPFTPALSGSFFGTDFNPQADRIRQVSNTTQSLRLNQLTGTVGATDTNLSSTDIVAVAYDRNDADSTTLTTLFAINSVAGTLVRIGGVDGPAADSPNGGVVNTIGSLGLGTNLPVDIGFDVSGLTQTPFATITAGGVSRLYTINLGTGAATLVGPVNTGGIAYGNLAAAVAPEPASAMLGVLGLGLLARRKR